MSFRSPLGRARGLGSAHGGTHHWWVMRISSIAMLPLSLWLVISVFHVSGSGYQAAVDWVSSPLNLSLLILSLGVLFHHMMIGLQAIIDDYVGHKAAKYAGIIAVGFLSVLLGAVSIVAALSIAFGS